MSDAHYDQVAKRQGLIGRLRRADWPPGRLADLFKSYCRYHISDHRPM